MMNLIMIKNQLLSLKLIQRVAFTMILVFSINGKLQAQYWGNQMMDAYSESLLNGQISVNQSSKIVSVDNNFLLFSDGYGFHIYDISDPELPSLMKRIGVPGLSGRFKTDQTNAFIVCDEGFSIVNYSNPSSPYVASYTKTGHSAYDVEIESDTDILFVSTSVGFEVFDISNIGNPSLINSFEIDDPYFNHNIALNFENNILYLTTGRVLYVIDISNLNSIQILNTLEFNPNTLNGTCHDGPKIEGNYLYIPVTTALHIYDISKADDPTLIYEGNPTAPNTLYSAAVRGNLFITGHSRDYGWFTIDVTDPTAPEQIQFYSTEEYGYGHGIGKIVNNLFFLINFSRGSDVGWRIRIIDVSDPANANQLSYIDSPTSGRATTHAIINKENRSYSLVAQENMAYRGATTWSYSSKFSILNLSNPNNPIIEAVIDVPSVSMAIAANDNYVVIRGYDLGYLTYRQYIYLVSLDDLQNPVLADVSQLPSQLSNDYPNSLFIHDDMLYVVADNMLQIYDLSGGYLQLINNTTTSGSIARGIKVKQVGADILAYIAASFGGLQIYNVTDPENIYLTSYHQPAGSAQDVWLEDNYAFLAVADGGIQIYDIANNTTVPVKNISTYAQAKNVVVENNLMFVKVYSSVTNSKLQVFDITDIKDPIDLGVYQTSGFINEIGISHNGRRLYVSDVYSHSIYRPLFNYNPLPFNLIGPDDDFTFTDDEIEFIWEEAEDANDDILTYTLYVWSSSWDTTFSINDSNSISINPDVFPGSDNYHWTMQVTDGYFTQNAVDTLSFNLIITDIVDNNEEIPQEFRLYQNYPNPFNPETNIKFDLAISSEVQITVYNMLGQVVNKIIHNNLPAGQHQVRWNGESIYGLNVTSGIYFISLKAKPESDGNEFNKTIKAILIK